MFDEAVGLSDGGEGLAGARGHLDEGAGAVGGERFLEVSDCGDLTVAERVGDEVRDGLEAGAEGVRLLDEFHELFGGVEGEDGASAGVGVALVGEVGFDAGRLVEERERVGPALGNELLRLGVASGLLFDGTEGRAELLGLDDPERLALHEQHVVSRTALGLDLAEGDSPARVEIQVFRCLHLPTGSGEHRIDLLAGLFLGLLVRRHRVLD